MTKHEATELWACKYCGKTPSLGYACGEYFIMTGIGCVGCDLFTEMHASEDREIDAWNKQMGVNPDKGKPWLTAPM